MKFNKKFFIFLVGSILTYAVFLIISDFTELSKQSIHFQFEYLPIILILIPTGWIALYLRWTYLLKNLNHSPPHKKNFSIFLSGFALGVTPGKIGELLKSELLKNNFDIPIKTSAPLILLERLYNATGLLILSSFGIFLFDFSGLVLSITIILLVIIFTIIRSKILFLKLLSRISKIKFLTKYYDSLNDSYDIVETSTKPKIFLISSILSSIYWFIESIAVYFILLSFGINIIDLITIIPIYATSMILGVLSFIPGGLVVTEGTLAGLLNLQGIEISVSLYIVIIIRLFTLWYPVVVGFIALKFTGAFQINSKNKED